MPVAHSFSLDHRVPRVGGLCVDQLIFDGCLGCFPFFSHCELSRFKTSKDEDLMCKHLPFLPCSSPMCSPSHNILHTSLLFLTSCGPVFQRLSTEISGRALCKSSCKGKQAQAGRGSPFRCFCYCCWLHLHLCHAFQVTQFLQAALH